MNEECKKCRLTVQTKHHDTIISFLSDLDDRISYTTNMLNNFRPIFKRNREPVIYRRFDEVLNKVNKILMDELLTIASVKGHIEFISSEPTFVPDKLKSTGLQEFMAQEEETTDD